MVWQANTVFVNENMKLCFQAIKLLIGIFELSLDYLGRVCTINPGNKKKRIGVVKIHSYFPKKKCRNKRLYKK